MNKIWRTCELSHISLFEIFINPIDATQHFNLRYSLVTVQLPFYDLWPLELPRRLLSSLNLHPLQIPIAELLPDGHVMRRPTIIQIINICSMFLTSVNSLLILAARLRGIPLCIGSSEFAPAMFQQYIENINIKGNNGDANSPVRASHVIALGPLHKQQSNHLRVPIPNYRLQSLIYQILCHWYLHQETLTRISPFTANNLCIFNDFDDAPHFFLFPRPY